MYVLIQTERYTSPMVDSAIGLVGVYRSYEQADDVMSNLFDARKDRFEESGYFETSAYLDNNDGTEYHWFIFNADSPEWIVNY